MPSTTKRVSNGTNSSSMDTGKTTVLKIESINNRLRSMNNKNQQLLNMGVQSVVLFKFIVFLIFLVYVMKLERTKCVCSRSWERNYIKYYSIAVLIVALVEFFNIDFYTKLTIVQYLMGIGGIVFIFVAFNYVNEMNKTNCECSEDWKKNALTIYAWLSIIILVLYFIVFFVALLNIKSFMK